MYAKIQASLADAGIDAPSFEEFWEEGSLAVPDLEAERVLFDAFRADPEGNRLRTPSGKIELFSETVAGFGYDDCPGHPTLARERGMARLAARAPLPARAGREQPGDAAARAARSRRPTARRRR